MLKLNGPVSLYNSLHTFEVFPPFALIILEVYASLWAEGHYVLPVKSFNRLQGNTTGKVQELLSNKYAVVLSEIWRIYRYACCSFCYC